jgi:hypothetical protein
VRSAGSRNAVERDELRAHAVTLGEQDPGEGDGGVAVGVAGEGANLPDGHGAEHANRERRPVAPDPAAGQQAEAGHPLVIDHRKQGHVEPRGAQVVQQVRGHVQTQFQVERIVEPVNERLGIEKTDAADAQDFALRAHPLRLGRS